MQRVSRLKFVILATIACVILFCVAAFSMSFAKWTLGDDNDSVEANGQSGLFYVEYPQYDSSSIVADSEVYLYGTIGGANKWSDNSEYRFYETVATGGFDRQFELVVTLSKEDDFKIHENGVGNYDGYYNAFYAGAKGDGWTDNHKVYVSGTYRIVLRRKNTVAHSSDADFDIRVGLVSASEPIPDSPESVAPDYQSVTVELSDTTFSLYFKQTSSGTARVHIWDTSNTGLTGTWGSADSTPFKANGNTIDLTSYSWADIQGIIVYINSNPQTPNLKSSAPLNSKPSNGAMYLVEEKSVSGSNLNVDVSLVGAQSAVNIITVPAGTPINAGLNEEVVPVRVMNGKTESKTVDGVTTHEYHNYICVSRQNADDSADDNSIAILEFTIDGKGITPDLSTIPVSSITLTRRDTDDNGNPLNGFIDPAPRIYNYDLANPVYLSQIGHGGLHRKPFGDVEEQGKVVTNMIEHYDDGMYVILYFADKKQQYFALDLSIETTMPAEFTLTASVNNTNMWDRYKKGFGEEWGYYLGGLINEVWMWNPTRTTKFEASTGTVKFDKDAEIDALDIGGDWKNWKNYNDAQRKKKIADFNDNPEFQYQIVDYSEGGTVNDKDGNPMWARYTKEEVDITLTINLTAGSKVKLCMLDWSGERGDLKDNNIMHPTTYFLPNVIHASPANLFGGADNYDDDLNFVIPQTGEYSFRFVGYVHDYYGKYMQKSNGEIFDSSAAGRVGIPNYNFVIDNLYISRANVVGEMITVTFDANSAQGGYFDADATTEQLVRFGNIVDLTKAPTPKNNDSTKNFKGWYYMDGGNAVDYDADPVLARMTLFAKWAGAEYEITFDANGGRIAGAATKKVTTGSDGKISADNLPIDPIRTGYDFDGWWTAKIGGTQIEDIAGTVFAEAQPLYAHWIKQKFDVTFDLNGLPFATTPAKQSIEYNEPVGEPTVIGVHDHYTLEGWYTDAACSDNKKFDFNNVITGEITLYAKWSADNGVYINDEFEQALEGNSTEVQATSVRVSEDNLVITVMYNNAKITNDEVKGNYFRQFFIGDGLKKGVYDFYYKPGSNDHGLWIEGYYIIAFDADGGTLAGEAELITAKANNTSGVAALATIPADPTKEGYSFAGWYDADGNNVTLNSNNAFSSSATLTAHWVQQHTVTFNANGGSWNDESTPHTQAINHGEKAERIAGPENAPEGKIFDCWSLSTGTSGGAAFDFENTAIVTDTILYAQWKEKPSETVTVTFNANGGKFSDSTTSKEIDVGDDGKITSDDWNSLAVVHTQAKYRFVGWFDTNAATGGNEVTADTVFSTSANVYARWIDPNKDLTYESSSAGGLHLTGCFQYHGDSSFVWQNGYKMEVDGYIYTIKIYLYENDYFDIRWPDSTEWRYNKVENPNSTYITPAADGENIRIKKTGYYTISVMWTNNPQKITITYEGDPYASSGGGGEDSNHYAYKFKISFNGQIAYISFDNGDAGLHLWNGLSNVGSGGNPPTIKDQFGTPERSLSSNTFSFLVASDSSGKWDQDGDHTATYAAGQSKKYSFTTKNGVTINIYAENCIIA